jgi:hypothetical protein
VNVRRGSPHPRAAASSSPRTERRGLPGGALLLNSTSRSPSGAVTASGTWFVDPVIYLEYQFLRHGDARHKAELKLIEAKWDARWGSPATATS